MLNMNSKGLRNQLNKLNLTNGFPYEDINLIQDNYKDAIPGLKEENQLTEDFNCFQLLIAGSCTYVIKGRRVPSFQKQYLTKSFFDSYPIYTLLEGELDNYPEFKKELEVFELARDILCKV